MSRIGRDGIFDELKVNSSLVLPRVEDATDISPNKGGIAYDLFEGPESQVWYSNGETWRQITPDGVLGYIVTNPPPPALLPDASVLIFNSSTSSWTSSSITKDVTMTLEGITGSVSLDGGPLDQFTSLDVKDVFVWDGAKWTNFTLPPSPPEGPAGGDLTGIYPNPVLAAAGTSAGTHGSTPDKLTGLSVNSKGQVMTVFETSVPIGSLPPGTIGNVYTESHIGIPAGQLVQLFYFANFPDGWVQFKLYVAWCDSLGRGGTYEYSGGLRIWMGTIYTPAGFSGGGTPTSSTFGATLQTVFGNPPTHVEFKLPPGGFGPWLNFQQDGAITNASSRMEWIGTIDPWVPTPGYEPSPPVYPP